MKKQHISRDSAKRLSNPAYIPLRVHRSLIEDDYRNYDVALFMHLVHQKARAIGSKDCLRDFLKALRLPNDEWASLIPIHASFAEERPALMTEEEFIASGCDLMLRTGVTQYFTDMVENLGQQIILLAAEVKR